MNIIKYLSIAMLMFSCAPLEEEYPPKWVIASQYLPREQLQGLQQAGFFEINDTIYAHHCDHNGNLITSFNSASCCFSLNFILAGIVIKPFDSCFSKYFITLGCEYLSKSPFVL